MTEQTIPPQQTNNLTDWISKELEAVQTQPIGDRLPTLKLESGRITKFTIDPSKPFDKWHDKESGVTKAILVVYHKGEKKNLWLNVKNPLYRQILEEIAKGKVSFAVSTIGTQKDTKYNLVEED